MSTENLLSVYKNAFDIEGTSTYFTSVVELIKSPALANVTVEYRSLPTGRRKYFFKRTRFAAVCFSGRFKERSVHSLEEHSGYICLDIDSLFIGHEKAKSLLTQDEFVHLVFTSPSGNGLKVVFQIEANHQTHLSYFNAIANYLQLLYGLEVDPSGKDVTRLCFLCYDPVAYYNPAAVNFTLQPGNNTAFISPRKVEAPQRRSQKETAWIEIEDGAPIVFN